MKLTVVALVLAVFAVQALASQETKAYIGVVTDTMCATDHKAMRISPDEKCVRDCVGDGTSYKYALAVGKDVYRLSDQETPAKFAGRKVKVTGALYAKTRILKVERIEAVK